MKDAYPSQEQSPKAEAIRLSPDLKQWNDRMDNLKALNARIITFRGAGSVNGIDPTEAQRAVNLLKEYVDRVTSDGTPVALMYDGDGDDRTNPDVGSVFGGLADALGDNPNVMAIAAQTEGWYSPSVENGAIESATGKAYETYVFPDDLPGSHASLTQSDDLVSYPNYEQVFVGPAGPIAFNQLQDLNDKATNRAKDSEPVRVAVLETSNNANLADKLNMQLEAAEGDPVQQQKVQAKISQREELPFGALFTSEGDFSVDTHEYPHVAFTVTKV